MGTSVDPLVRSVRRLSALNALASRKSGPPRDTIDRLAKLQEMAVDLRIRGIQRMHDYRSDSFANLGKIGRDRVRAAEEMARLNNKPFSDNGFSIVVRNDNQPNAQFTKPREVLQLTPEETKAYFERQEALRSGWDNMVRDIAKWLGWSELWHSAMAENIRAVKVKMMAATSDADRKHFERLIEFMAMMESLRKYSNPHITNQRDDRNLRKLIRAWPSLRSTWIIAATIAVLSFMSMHRYIGLGLAEYMLQGQIEIAEHIQIPYRLVLAILSVFIGVTAIVEKHRERAG